MSFSIGVRMCSSASGEWSPIMTIVSSSCFILAIVIDGRPETEIIPQIHMLWLR